LSIDQPDASRQLPDRPNLRHLKDQAKDLLRIGAAATISDAQFKIARLYGFASWPKLKAHIDSLEEIGQLKQAIDTNDIDRVKTLMTRKPSLHRAPAVRVRGERSLCCESEGPLSSRAGSACTGRTSFAYTNPSRFRVYRRAP
jgi:hypothetical protein